MRFIGSKTLLLEEINKIIIDNVDYAENFCDLFAGTGVVGDFFKEKFKIYSNDILYFSYVIQKSKIENNKTPQFSNIKKKLSINNPINYLDNIDNLKKSIDINKCFLYQNYSPKGNRMYLSEKNSLTIDCARITIEKWRNESLLSDNEYYYLLAAIIEGVPYVSNISGTYGAFLKKWDKRAQKDFKLKPHKINTGYSNDNLVFNQDANELIKNINGDILYIDPPYNNRQYLPNYHLLETIAKYDYPKIKGITGVRSYDKEKSKFCNRKEVLKAFSSLVKDAKFKHLIISYNNEGLMSKKDIENILKSFCKSSTYKLYEVPYRRFKSRSTNFNGKIKEFLFYIKK